MLRATQMAMALAKAAEKTPKTFNNYVARAVDDRVQHTDFGVVKEPDITIRVSNKTKQAIAEHCGVRV